MNYVCATKNCSFSISLAVDQTTKRLKDPYEITNISKDEKHKDANCKHDDDYFNQKIFYYNIKRKVKVDVTRTVQQIYELNVITKILMALYAEKYARRED